MRAVKGIGGRERPQQFPKSLRCLIFGAKPAVPQRPRAQFERRDPSRHPAADRMIALQLLQRLKCRLQPRERRDRSDARQCRQPVAERKPAARPTASESSVRTLF